MLVFKTPENRNHVKTSLVIEFMCFRNIQNLEENPPEEAFSCEEAKIEAKTIFMDYQPNDLEQYK